MVIAYMLLADDFRLPVCSVDGRLLCRRSRVVSDGARSGGGLLLRPDQRAQGHAIEAVCDGGIAATEEVVDRIARLLLKAGYRVLSLVPETQHFLERDQLRWFDEADSFRFRDAGQQPLVDQFDDSLLDDGRR